MKYSRRHPIRALRIWTLPPAQRRAVRAEQQAEAQMRRERDNVFTPEMRTAARDAEARKFPTAW